MIVRYPVEKKGFLNYYKRTMKADKRQKYLQHILASIPHSPGVYKFRNAKKEIIYIGKAKDLKNRVSSYFQSAKDHTSKTKKMVEQIEDINYIEVASDLEAVMLETNMIKEIRPKYNILMKDDKNYVYIKITVNEDFPRILITRHVDKDKARYFGPKTAKHKVLKTLKILKRIFPYRHCSLAIEYQMPKKEIADPKRKHNVKVTKASIKYPCIDYHIKRCIGPCIGTVDKEEYRHIINQVIRFLEGKHEEILQKLKDDMHKAAAEKKYEIAAAIRDKIQAVEDIMEHQRISTPDHSNMDVINYIIVEEKVFFNLFQIRNGKIINQENFEMKATDDTTGDPQSSPNGEQQEDPDALTSFLEQYYEKATDIPSELLVPHEVEEEEILQEWLSKIKGKKVKITIPKRGHKDHLLDLSHKNAQGFAKLSQTKWQGHQKTGRDEALKELGQLLNLDKAPKRLECFDVSHFAGSNTVSSMVVFENGFPRKADYRKFKLSQEGSPDDFASMEETLTRRLKYIKPSIAAKEIRVLKAKKKELEALKVKKNRAYFIIHDSGEKIGHAQIFTSDTKRVLTEKLKLSQSSDLRTIMKKIAEKAKTKRLYLKIIETDLKKYEESGCQPVRKIPDGFKVSKKEIIIVFDATKHKPDASFKKVPDLIVIDGGKGQLSSAIKALKKYKLDIPIISIAKREEEIFLPGKSTPILLQKNNPMLHIIQHIRNESHRFAITFHQGLQMKATRSSILDEISGIGETTKMKLLKHFGSPEAMKSATMYELEKVVGKKNAMRIKEALNA